MGRNPHDLQSRPEDKPAFISLEALGGDVENTWDNPCNDPCDQLIALEQEDQDDMLAHWSDLTR